MCMRSLQPLSGTGLQASTTTGPALLPIPTTSSCCRCSHRYLVKLDGHWVYSSCMLEGYSRMILAGMASEHQALPALLQLLCAALSTYGCPEGIVSDHGAVFQAHNDVAILKALESEPKYIE